MTLVQAVFFDLDGTLIDDEEAARRCTEATCRHFETSIPGVDCAALTTTFMRLGKEYWTHRVASGVDDNRGSRIALWQQALSEHRIERPGLGEEFAVLYAALRAKAAVPFEDAQPVVEALTNRGYRLAVITNGAAEVQRYKLELVGLDDYFDAFIASSDFGAGKPDLVVFEAALDALGADPAQTWHIGDNLAADVAGALNAGIRAAWLNRPGETRRPEHPEPHAELRTLWELPSILTPAPRGG
ncbi:MAG: HAD family hydrolase [Dehalococcoidia bacterium]